MPLKGHGIQFAFAPLIYLEIFIYFMFIIDQGSFTGVYCLLFE